MKPTLEERFDSKWEWSGDCWRWTAAKDKDGYGYFTVQQRTQKAHRFSYEYHHGKIPSGCFVLHTCDNPSCVRPGHLFLGNALENMQDKIAKGRARYARGEGVGNSKLTEAQVKFIRQDTRGNKVLATELGVTHALISAIRLRKCWRHVE